MSSNIDFQKSEKTRAGPENSAALFVSLYVVVLAFFILLTSNAQFDAEKTKNVTESVKKAFSVDVPTDTEIKTPSVGSELSVTQFFNEMQTAVHSVVPIEEMEVITDGKRMIMIMDDTALFNRDDPNLRYDRREFYSRMSDTLTKWRDGMQMQLAFLQGVAKPIASDANAASTLQITRAGNFARFMENRGVLPSSLDIAIEQGNARKITLIFDVVEFNADALKFEDEPAAPAAPEKQSIPLFKKGGTQ